MAFVFDTTTSGTTSNSYVSVSDANDYFAGHVDGYKWDELDTTAKQKALVTSTRKIDELSFGGYRTITGQSLKFPRQNLMNDEGLLFASNQIPIPIKNATCEFAFYFITTDDRDFNDWQIETYESFEAGPLSVKFKKLFKALPTSVQDALKNLGLHNITNLSEFPNIIMRW